MCKKNIIEFFNNTKNRDFIDCRITVLRDMFLYYGLSFDSYDIFVLGQTIDCSLFKFKLKKESPLELALLGGARLEIEENVFNCLGIYYEKKRFGENCTDIKNTIAEYIDKGKPLLARIDIRDVFDPQRTPKKVDIHCVSTVLICGYDFGEEDYVYIELKEHKNSGLKKLKMRDFKKAIDSNTFPLEIGRLFFVPFVDADVVRRANKNREDYLWRALHKTVKTILNGEKVILDSQYEYREITSGIDQLKEVVKSNTDLKNGLEKSAQDNLIKQRILTMYFYTLRDMLTPGSNFCYRLEFGETLINMAEKLKEKRLKNLGKKYKDISKSWRDLRRCLARSDNLNDKKDIGNYVSTVNHLINEIHVSEYEELSMLNQIVNEKVNA